MQHGDIGGDLVRPEDIVATARQLVEVLRPVEEERFARTVVPTVWTGKQTVAHIADALLLYCRYVATRATGRLQPIRDGRPGTTTHDLLDDVVDAAIMLQGLVGQLAPGETAFHPAGFADRSGWAAMACDELAIHGLDIASTVGIAFTPDPELVESVVKRLFPWTPDVGQPVQRLLWANGRTALGPHPQLDQLWYWWCRPLQEWDGRRHTRTAPPAW